MLLFQVVFGKVSALMQDVLMGVCCLLTAGFHAHFFYAVDELDTKVILTTSLCSCMTVYNIPTYLT